MVDSNDPNVRQLAMVALGGLHKAPAAPRSKKVLLERAHILRAAVKRHIKTFDLATGYATFWSCVYLLINYFHYTVLDLMLIILWDPHRACVCGAVVLTLRPR